MKEEEPGDKEVGKRMWNKWSSTGWEEEDNFRERKDEIVVPENDERGNI